MYIDFEYDGLKLSDMGYMICQFDSNGLETVSNGAQITFNTVPVQNGALYVLASTQYDTCLEATFQICKNPCKNIDDMSLNINEIRSLSSWLGRNKYLKFKLLDDEYIGLYFEASFNISQIRYGGNVIGLELHMKTNRPFALMEPRTIKIVTTKENEKKIINDTSDKEGYIYPYMEVKINQSGEEISFFIRNNAEIEEDGEDRLTRINNCSSGEIIYFDYPVVSSSYSSHNTLADDFNWNFFRISNTFRNSKNELVISHPCEIKIVYSPIAMIGI